MPQTVLITGVSSGIGRAAAKLFQSQGWQVIATLRHPSTETELNQLPNVLVTALDVTQPESIRQAIATGIARFGRIDAVVNNAGYGLVGPFEATTPAQVQRQLATNLTGLMDVVREVLPLFRSQRQGTLINVASMGGRLTTPYYSVYHASKWAVDGYTEALRYELQPLGIRVKIIEPGAIKTAFQDGSADVAEPTTLTDYQAQWQRARQNMQRIGQKGTPPEVVARAIYRAATDGSHRLRYVVGQDAKLYLWLRRFISDGLWYSIVRHSVLK